MIDIAADGMSDVAQTIRAGGGRVDTRVADVSAADQVGAAVGELVGALGGLDLLVHCAAILGPGRWAQQPPEAFERVIRIDLLGTANVLRAALPGLRQSRGAAVCIASTAALHGWPHMAAYSAAKFGVAGFCDAVRPELAREGVLLTAVFPLLIDTPLLQGGDTAPILRQGKAIPASAVVEKTLAAVAKRRARVFVPETVRLVAALHAIAPSLLDWYGRRFGFPPG